LPLGVLPPVTVEVRVTVSPEGVWRAPQAELVRQETMVAMDGKKRSLPRAAGEPRRGEFALLPGGGIEFAREDAGRRVLVRYEFSPRRVVLFQTPPPADHPEAAALLDQALTEELSKKGFVLVPVRELMQAAAAAGMEASPSEGPPPPEKLVAFARRADAAYVLGPTIAIGDSTRPGSVDTGLPWPRDRVQERARHLWEEEQTIELPITRHSLSGEVRLVVVDGATGAAVWDQSQRGQHKVRLYRFSAARRALVRSLAQQAVAAWRALLREGKGPGEGAVRRMSGPRCAVAGRAER
jgi:hypothetical protein